MTAKVVVLVLYALMIIGVGLMGMRKVRSFGDFFLGGGNIGPWMTAFTYAASYFSAVLFIGFAGKIGWNFGYSGLWIAVGNALIGVLCVWYFLGRRIRKIVPLCDATTMPEFFEKRYDSRFLKLFAAVCVFVFFVPYSAAVFMGLSYLFESNFNIPFWMALLMIGGFTAIYMVMGGYKSMAMIDVAFGVIMVVGTAILLVFTVQKGGGLGKMTADLAAIDPKLTEFVGPPGLWPLLSLVFLTSVAPFGMPQLLQKFYAIRDDRSIKVGMIVSTCLAVVIGGVAYFVGSSTQLFLSPETTPRAFVDGSPVFDLLMPELLANVIPSSLSLLILLLVLSASMSTLAALVLISSASVVKDFYGGFVNRAASSGRLTLLMRLASVLFILVSVILAAAKPAAIVAVLAISWGAIGSAFLGPFLWGMFSFKVNRTGAIASTILGLGACLGLFIYWGCNPKLTPQAGSIGMIVSLLANPLVSMIMPSATNPWRDGIPEKQEPVEQTSGTV